MVCGVLDGVNKVHIRNSLLLNNIQTRYCSSLLNNLLTFKIESLLHGADIKTSVLKPNDNLITLL